MYIKCACTVTGTKWPKNVVSLHCILQLYKEVLFKVAGTVLSNVSLDLYKIITHFDYVLTMCFVGDMIAPLFGAFVMA